MTSTFTKMSQGLTKMILKPCLMEEEEENGEELRIYMYAIEDDRDGTATKYIICMHLNFGNAIFQEFL